MKFEFDPTKVLFEGSNFVVYDVTDLLPVHKNYPHGTDVVKPNGKRAIPAHWCYGNRGREVDEAFVHQTAGSYQPGFKGVFNTASFIVRDPAYFDDGKWRGNGRGWPAMCYSYFFSYEPELTPDDKFVLFRCRPDDQKSWHTGGHNQRAIALGFQGYFKSHHMGRFKPRKGDKTNGTPSEAQRKMLAAAWPEYFKGVMGLTDDQVFGHFEAKSPKAACPGDWLEQWVLDTRSGAAVTIDQPQDEREPFEVPFEVPGMVQLDTWERRQGALLLLGYDLGAYGPKKNGVDGDPGLKTRAAIEGVEASFGLKADGVYDDRLDFMLQLAHLALGTEQEDIDELA
jgi:hypothetical protein